MATIEPFPGTRRQGPIPEMAASVRGLHRSFGDRTVIDGLDLDVRAGEFVALMGASGAGKSTLLRILAGLDTEIRGEVAITPSRAVVFQAPRLLPWKRVWRNVVLGLAGRPDRRRAETALAEVGLARLADAWPKTLSGGEAQRAALARALVREPGLLLLDEPFAALDALTRLHAQDLVASLWRSHAPAVLLVTHDVDEAITLADRVLVMHRGVIAESVPVGIGRPRDAGDGRFVRLRAQLLGRLGVMRAATAATDAVGAGRCRQFHGGLDE